MSVQPPPGPGFSPADRVRATVATQRRSARRTGSTLVRLVVFTALIAVTAVACWWLALALRPPDTPFSAMHANPGPPLATPPSQPLPPRTDAGGGDPPRMVVGTPPPARTGRRPFLLPAPKKPPESATVPDPEAGRPRQKTLW